MSNERGKRGITPEQAADILSKNGMELSLPEAALVLDFLYKMAILQCKQQAAKKP
jgi:hypothetical protein